MLGMLLVVLLSVWVLGVSTAHTLGGFIHVLLVAALGVGLVRVIRPREPVA